VRGYSFSRANDWGTRFKEDVQTANDETVVITMIESKEGVENIHEIVAVEGLDAIFIGPYDLSGSYGIPGQTQDPVVQDACRRVVDACAQAGKAVGLLVVRPTADAIRAAIEGGYTLPCLGLDTVFLDEGARAARALALSVLAEQEKG
jgi:2-keto-3-deoxy-L-rhamnonate aldolase RhmA